MELSLDSGQIRKDIGVVILQIIDNCCLRVVMNKLGALVEESRVVLVCFHHKIAATAQSRGYAKIRGHATNEKTRLKPGAVQNPRQHTGSSGFTMGPRRSQHPLILKNMSSQPLRPRRVVEALIQHCLNNGLPTRQRIAHHHAAWHR